MGKGKDIKVTKESPSGRNTEFQHGNKKLTRPQLVKEIEKGKHQDYHIRKINDIKTPVSNPDKSKKNNLG